MSEINESLIEAPLKALLEDVNNYDYKKRYYSAWKAIWKARVT